MKFLAVLYFSALIIVASGNPFALGRRGMSDVASSVAPPAPIQTPAQPIDNGMKNVTEVPKDAKKNDQKKKDNRRDNRRRNRQNNDRLNDRNNRRSKRQDANNNNCAGCAQVQEIISSMTSQIEQLKKLCEQQAAKNGTQGNNNGTGNGNLGNENQLNSTTPIGNVTANALIH